MTTDASHFLRMHVDGLSPEEGAPAEERLLAGAPRFRTWNIEDRDGLYAGIWESTPGLWRVEYSEWEYCRILSGLSVLTEDGGASHTLRAGDSFILRPGFRGSWEVLETTRKEYVILDRAEAEG